MERGERGPTEQQQACGNYELAYNVHYLVYLVMMIQNEKYMYKFAIFVFDDIVCSFTDFSALLMLWHFHFFSTHANEFMLENVRDFSFNAVIFTVE